MDRTSHHPFISHSEWTVRSWAKRLGMFRFFQAYGGHNNDGDQLVVAFKYSSLDQLVAFFETLGIKIVVHRVCPPRGEAGRIYRADELAKFPSLILGTRWIERRSIKRSVARRYSSGVQKTKSKSSSMTGTTLQKANVPAAEIVERTLSGAPLDCVDPPIDNDHCVRPEYYPDYFG